MPNFGTSKPRVEVAGSSDLAGSVPALYPTNHAIFLSQFGHLEFSAGKFSYATLQVNGYVTPSPLHMHLGSHFYFKCLLQFI